MALESTAYDTFLSDPVRDEVWLFEVTGRNILTDTETTYYFSSAKYGTLPTDTLANQRYDAMIDSVPESSSIMEGFGPGFFGLAPPRDGGTLKLIQREGNLDLGTLAQLNDVPFGQIAFGGRRAVVRHGGYSKLLGRMLTYAEFGVTFIGVCDGDPHMTEDGATFRLATKDRNFEHPLQTATFWGMSWGLYFDGSTHSANLGNNSAHNLTTGSMTWEFPLYYEAFPGATEPILVRGLLDTDGWEIQLSTTGRVRLRTNQSGANQVSTSAVLPTYTTSWVSVVYDGTTDSPIFYVNGVRAQGAIVTHTNPTTASRTMYFARDNAGAVFLGPAIVSEIRVWNVARTADQINETMHRPLDASEIDGTLVALYHLDEGTGTNIEDESSIGITGTITSATQWVHSGTGHEDIAGEQIPDPWGPVKNFVPMLIDENRRIYQVSAMQIDGFDDDFPVTESGYASIALDTPHTSYIDFILDDPGDGKYNTCITAGGTWFMLGSEPSGTITCDIRGNAPGGTYLSTAADQIRWIICNRGPVPLTDPTDLNTSSFTTFDAACPQIVGHMWESNETISEVINFILRSVGAVGWFTRTGGLFSVKQVIAVEDETPGSIVITENDVAQLDRLDRSKPIWRVSLWYDRNYTVMGTGDMLPPVLGTDRERFIRHEWRKKVSVRFGVRNDFKDSEEIELFTGLSEGNDAVVEATRQGTLYRRRDQGFRILIRRRFGDLDLMDVVRFNFNGYKANGEKQALFDTDLDDDPYFYVVGIADDATTGGTRLTLWRNRVPTLP